MNRLLELASKLTPVEVQQVEDFAASLVAEHEVGPTAPKPPTHVNVDALVGLCEGMGGDMSDKELIRDAWDDLLKKYD